MDARLRLDQFLTDHQMQPSRARARDAILRGAVTVDGKVATKPGLMVTGRERIEISDDSARYVSRAALKLKAGLEASSFVAKDRVAVDLGASTGGFTQILLEAGARHVYAVDVGHGQLADKLRPEPRITLIEGRNARDLTPRDFGSERIEAIVCDVSFISLRLVLPPMLEMAADKAWGIFLVKPQFEVGKAHIGKGGIVKDKQVATHCAQQLAIWLDNQPGWQTTLLIPSPVLGADGNQEFLLAGTRTR